MKVDSAAVAGSINPRIDTGADHIDRERRMKSVASQAEVPAQNSRVPAEEILDQIKALTEGGAYSVRFEMDSQIDQVVVRLVDTQSGETIRQLPPEELVDLSRVLKELRGSLVDITS